MRTTLLVLLFTVGSAGAGLSQDADITGSDYYPIPELEKFEGEWIGVSDTADTLVIRLYLQQKVFLKGPDIYSDRLVGQHTVSRNGTVIENSVGTERHTLTNGVADTGVWEADTVDVLRFFFHDITLNKEGRAVLFVKRTHPLLAVWRLSMPETWFVEEDVPADFNDFTAPRQLTLYKQADD